LDSIDNGFSSGSAPKKALVDRSAGQTHYYKETALWGAFFFSDMRELVERCIVAAVETR
jgi:hypothetical protein